MLKTGELTVDECLQQILELLRDEVGVTLYSSIYSSSVVAFLDLPCVNIDEGLIKEQF